MPIRVIEIWKSIPGYEGRYIVSNLGRVRSLLGRGRTLKQSPGPKGYLCVGLHKDGKQTTVPVHQLVYHTFRGWTKVVRHFNDDKLNNSLSNLRGGTQSDNMKDAICNGRYNHIHVSGTRHWNNKLSTENVEAIIASSESSASLARKYGINRSTVSRIRNGLRWSQALGAGI